MENEIRELKRQYGIWLGLPPEARKPDEQNQAAMAVKLGVVPKTLSIWHRDPYVQEIAQSAVKLLFGNEQIGVIQAIVEKAKEGNPQMARLYADILGWTTGRKTDGSGPASFEVTFKTESGKKETK